MSKLAEIEKTNTLHIQEALVRVSDISIQAEKEDC